MTRYYVAVPIFKNLELESDEFIEEKQLPIDDASKSRLLDIRIRLFYDESDGLAEQLFAGDVTIGQWEESMKQAIRQLHSSAAAIGKGGWDEMTFADWGRLGNPVKAQYAWLHDFAQHIDSNRDTISLAAIKARARLYGDASGHATTMMQAGRIITDELKWIPRDGSTECLVGCHCRWELSIISSADDFNTVEAIWHLGVADHCPDCVGRDGFVQIIRIHELVDVPAIIGDL